MLDVTDSVFSQRVIMACDTQLSTVCVVQGLLRLSTTTLPECVWSSKAIMASHNGHRLTVFDVQGQCCQGWWCHAMYKVNRSCVLSKVYDDIPRPTSFNFEFSPRAMMACNSRRCPTFFTGEGLWGHATHDFFLPFVLSKGEDGMPQLTCSTMCTIHTRWWTAMPVIIHSCVRYNNDDGMPRMTSSNIVCCSIVMMRMLRVTSSYPVCYPRAMMTYHSWRRLKVCVVQYRCVITTLDIVQLYLLSKVHDGMPRMTSSVYVWCSRAMIACHARRRALVSVVQSLW